MNSGAGLEHEFQRTWEAPQAGESASSQLYMAAVVILDICSSEERRRGLICHTVNVSWRDGVGLGLTKAADPVESAPRLWSRGPQGLVTNSKAGAVFSSLLTQSLISTFTGDYCSGQHHCMAPRVCVCRCAHVCIHLPHITGCWSCSFCLKNITLISHQKNASVWKSMFLDTS